MGLVLYATLNGAQIADGRPILTCLGGDIVLTELGQFSQSRLTLAASDEQTVRALEPYTLIEVVQDDLQTTNPNDPGTLTFGYVLDPEAQITDRDEHTITLTLDPLTVECTWRRQWDWQANTNLGIVAERIGALTPAWSGIFTNRYDLDPSGTPYDINVIVNSPSATNLALFLNTAQQYSHFARQGVDANGVPARVLEMGQFGAAPTITLQDPKGADADAIASNPSVRLITSLTRHPNDVRDLVNVVAPFGGGRDRDSLLTLERLWRILNDPLYADYGKYGNAPGSIFPEYDPNAYPISDPENPPTGQTQWLFLDVNGNQVAGGYAVTIGVNADGTKTAYAVDGAGRAVAGIYPVLSQGAFGTRGFTLDGHALYFMYDAASYATYGYRAREYIDSALTVPADDVSRATQTDTARALYAGAITQFKRFAHPHHSFDCTAEGRGRPTRAGDLVTIDYQRVSVPDTTAVVEMDVYDSLRVMRVTRTFQESSPTIDTYVLSNLGRFDQDDASQAADTSRQLVATQMSVGTGLAKDSIVIRDNIDALNPITHYFYIPPEHYRYHQVRIRCDWFPFRGTATTAANIAGTPVVSADVEVLLATPSDLGTQNQTIQALDTHIHTIEVAANTGGTPNVGITISGGAGVFRATSGGHAKVSTDTPTYDTTHAHTVAPRGATIAHIPAGQRLGNLPAHTHDVEKRIPTGQPAPVAITLSINGIALPSGAATSGSRNSAGAFTSAFIVNDIGPYLDAIAPGTDVPIVFTAGTNASNPNGVGYLVVTITEVEELGGLATKILPA